MTDHDSPLSPDPVAAALPPPGDGLLAGLRLPLTGAWLLWRTPALWRWAVVPVLLLAVLLGLGLWATLAWTPDLLAAWLPRPTATGVLGAFLAAAWTVAAFLAHGLVFAALSVASWLVSGVLAAPFHDRLSHEVEVLLGLEVPDEDFEVGRFVSDVLTGIRHSLTALLLWAALAVPLLVLNLVPGVGSAAYVAANTGLSAVVLARDVQDYAWSRRRLGFRDKLVRVRAQGTTALGLGLACVLLMGLPLANLVAYPAAVVGGTLLATRDVRRSAP